MAAVTRARRGRLRRAVAPDRRCYPVRDLGRAITVGRTRTPESPMSPQHETTHQDHAVVAKYLLEAHGKECQLETALKGQLALAQRSPVQHALRDHLGVTRRQIGALERRIDE